jgi:phospholipid/cholesterol/gamma-HCH transport system permease protein
MDAASCRLEAAEENGTLRISAAGAWETELLAEADVRLRGLAAGPKARRARIDLAEIETLDTAGAWVLYRTLKTLREAGVAVEFEGARPEHQALIERVAEGDREPAPARPVPHPLFAALETTGRAAITAFAELGGLLSFLGLTVVTGARVLAHPERMRVKALLVQIERGGLHALPIVGLVSFLIGVVVAYQGADQLRRFGAEIFTVNLVGISMLREMGILLASILVAGRSGSAYTAQIGTMQVNEEVDALRTLGLDPIEVLVLPRVLALTIALPLLTVYADAMGLAGGALMAWATLDISLTQFIERLRTVVPLWAFWVGVIKAPFFGLLIALIGCREGLNVVGSAESVGLQTTKSVVVSIFLVIVADAMFSIFFSTVGV